MRRSPGSAQPPPRGLLAVLALPRQQRNFTILTFTVGALLTAGAVALAAMDPTITPTLFGLVLALFLAIGLTRPVKIQRGSAYTDYRFWEYPFIVGLAVVPGYAVATAMMITATLGAAQALLAYPQRRASVPLQWGSHAIGVVVGCYVATLFPPWSYAVGFLVASVIWEALRVGHDITYGGKAYALSALRDHLQHRLALALVVPFLVTALVMWFGDQRIFLIVVPVSVLVIYWMAQARIQVVEERRAWQKMEEISARFVGEVEDHRIITMCLTEALPLFAATEVEIALHGVAPDPGTRWTQTSHPDAAPQVEHVTASADGMVPMPPETASSKVIPLKVADHDLGYLRLEWDPAGPDKHTRTRMSATFAHSVAASIANARHNQHIRRTAAEKAVQAETDPLTGLGNRTQLAERGPDLLAEATDIDRSCALLLFDLDGFKRINDTLGHAAGDQVLVEVADRLKRNVRSNDLTIRLGGDEFAVLATDLETVADAERLATKIASTLIPPIEVSTLQLSVESSIGIALYPNDGTNVESLLKNADIAMYRAKALGRGRTMRYSPDINFETTESLHLATELRRAVFSADELVLHYQPQVAPDTGRVVGMEALVRWDHPALGLLYPDRFVPIAERSNVVRQFTIAILRKAVGDRARIREEFPDATVSVNLSAQNLLDTSLPGDVRRILSEYGVNADELVLEVTETATAHDMLAAERVLRELAELGCHIAMDDFGSGYATLESLRTGSPINEIKIDRGFVEHVSTSDTDLRVARSIIDIAHAFECRVVAEGVEDATTYRMLRDLSCDVVQGYHIHRPAPLEDILVWYRTQTQYGGRVQVSTD